MALLGGDTGAPSPLPASGLRLAATVAAAALEGVLVEAVVSEAAGELAVDAAAVAAAAAEESLVDAAALVEGDDAGVPAAAVAGGAACTARRKAS